MLKYLTGDANATIATATALAETNNNNLYESRSIIGTDSSVFRASTISAGTQGSTSYSAKTAEQDVNVRLGGLDWTATYLSKDKNGNTILTLWLDSSKQDAFAGRSSTEGKYYGFIDGVLYSSYAVSKDDKSYNSTYPSAMYGSSYVNAVALNNGGYYSTSRSSASRVSSSSSSVFSLFTMSSYGLTNYLVTPRDVSWQEDQETIDTAYSDYTNNTIYTTYSNNSWKTLSSSAFCWTNLNYSSKKNYADWADSYLWLISTTESSLWNLSSEQKDDYFAGYSGSYDNLGTVGSDERNINYRYWERTADFQFDGYVYCYRGYISTGSVTDVYAVRPALHLNLTEIEESMIESVSVGELFDSNTKNFNQDNYKILLKYLTGNANATLHDVTNLANLNSNNYSSEYSGTNAAYFRNTTLSSGVEGSVSYSAKERGDIKVQLGGLNWDCVYLSQDKNGNTILTLWLDDSKQTAWVDKSFNDTGYYTSSSRMWSKYADNFSEYTLDEDEDGNEDEDDASYEVDENLPKISDLNIAVAHAYGTSYVNSVTLNNGGNYYVVNGGNYTTELNEQSSSSVFALFTMAQFGLTDYLVSPSNISWQEGQDNYYYEAYSEDWGNNYLWLPSCTETCNSGRGLWDTSIKQRKSYTNVWLRSAKYYTVEVDGDEYDEDGNPTYYITVERVEPLYLSDEGRSFFYASIDSYKGVRPALHLNLSAIYEELYAEDLSDGKGVVTVNPARGEYDGNAKTPTITVKYNGITLAKDVDYTLSYTLNGVTVSEFKAAGTYTITATGKKAYAGSVSTTYTIYELLSLGDGKGLITVNPASEDYTGTARAPTITVKYNGVTLTLGTDYTLRFTLNGAQVGELTAAGTYTITATGMGGYCGSISATYTINGAKISGIALADASKVIVFKRSEGSPRACLMDGTKQLMLGIDYTITHSVNFDALTGTATVTFMGGYTGTKTLNYTLALLDPIDNVYVAIFS